MVGGGEGRSSGFMGWKPAPDTDFVKRINGFLEKVVTQFPMLGVLG